MTEKTPPATIVVGAGLAGLLAAQLLQESGRRVTLLESEGRTGGRMATCEIEMGDGQRATFDYGAQYFTVRDERFRKWVSRWQKEGVVAQWSTGFATPDTSAYRDGHPRYRGKPSMAAIPAHLARGLDVRLETRVVAVTHEGSGWQVTTATGERYDTPSLILTAPVEQSLTLLSAGSVPLPEAARKTLAQIDYDPCWAVMAVLSGASAIPEPGGVWPGGDKISWMADNQRKGISTLPAVTIHGSPEFSNAHFDDDPDEVARLLLDAAAPWLGSEVIDYRARRWRYSIPVHMYHERCLTVAAPGPLVFAGDAFAGPRVEGAALSGLAAGEAVAGG